MRKHSFVTLALLLAGCGLATFGAETSGAGKPNIILILSDDVGLGDIGCTGGPFKTPNIDALAKGGTSFEYCYATPLCGPSRWRGMPSANASATAAEASRR